jgi:bifunctional non-homologous end joining protein LigD
MKQSGASTFSFLEPMLALPVRELPVGGWIYELKFDGRRVLALKSDGKVRLLSRNRKDFSSKYPQLIDSLTSLPAKSATLDGEIVALDQDGRSSFQLLQNYGRNKKTPIVYYAFD